MKISIIKKFLIFVSVFFVLALAHSWYFLHSVNELERYNYISGLLPSIKSDIATLEYRLDIAVIGSELKKDYGMEELSEQVMLIDKRIERLKGLPETAILDSDPMLANDYKTMLDEWDFVKQKAARLKAKTSREEVLLAHNDIDIKTSGMAERLERVRKFIDNEKEKAFSAITSRAIDSFFASMLIASIAVYIFYLKMIKPVKAMAMTAEKMAQGNLNIRLKAHSADEIGILGQSANRLADKIQEANAAAQKSISDKEIELDSRIRELAAINKIAGLIGSSISEDETLGIALDELIAMSKADAGLAHILEQQNGTSASKFILKVYRGLPHTLARVMEMEESGFMGLPIEKKDRLHVNVSELNSRFKPLLEETGFKKLCIVPIVNRENILGIITLLSRSADGFSGNSCLFAKTLADTLASIVQNINLLQQELKARQLMERIIYQSPVSTVVFDKNGRCVLINPAAKKLFGIENEKQIVKKYNMLDAMPEYAALIKTVFEGKTVKGEFAYNMSGAHVQARVMARKFKTTMFPIIGHDGSVTHIVAMQEA